MSLLDNYSVQKESEALLWEGILRNPLHRSLPDGIEDAARTISFSGSRLPYLPVNWRFAESVSALKAFQGAMLNVLLHKKYGLPYQRIHIDTDHALLFLMSPVHPLVVIDPEGEKIPVMLGSGHPGYEKYFPSLDVHRFFEPGSPFIDIATTNIYKLGDGRYYHVHASMNANPSQAALGIKREDNTGLSSFKEACAVFKEAASKFSAQELDTLINDQYRQAGTICHSIDEFRASEQGKANAHVGLYEIHHYPNAHQRPTWWTDVPGQTSPARPLFGLKIVDLTRIIAAPVVVRELAEMGASVMRITASHLPDRSQLQLDMGWGKWNAHLDLRKEEDRARLRELIMDADIVIDGYRPNVLKKWGFGKEEILEMVSGREKGIVYAHENCYGWNGPWAHRSGWQQISDAVTGVSLEFGRSMGHDEPVTPVFFNSDFCAGIAGAVGILNALIQRAEIGGSFVVDIALNYYSQWLVSSCGIYTQEIWDDLWSQYGKFTFRCTDNRAIVVPAYMKMLEEKNTPTFHEKYFEIRKNGALGVDVKTIKPVLRFEEESVKLGYNVGSRPNGTDVAKWPSDLMTEIVT
ncbi:hypothetical protein D9756_007851 [Leucocoprinus leucothites]|uniref:CoA-transferase family III n=1 Tax=Leucocoprinus leucothites TaxID=201217 RepID=A0A8H5D403_9AGAR|nr:hypothetical protein D9756_007851 [Leucoagaricus leucothites]